MLLLSQGEDEGGDSEETGTAAYDKNLMPELLLTFSADDAFLRERIINLPESVVTGTHNTEHKFLKRLAKYRSENTDFVSVYNYFDELELEPKIVGELINVFRACYRTWKHGKYRTPWKMLTSCEYFLHFPAHYGLVWAKRMSWEFCLKHNDVEIILKADPCSI